jgi:hypothetical protein
MKIGEIYQEILTASINENKSIDEEYPSSWNIEEFKKLKSFNQRIQYCQQHLNRISSGSSRIVYKVDDEKVLKLAKNKKGLSQNELEAVYSKYDDLSDILARTFDSADDNTWVEMELAKKLTPPIFKQITGFDWEDYKKVMDKQYYRANPTKDRWGMGDKIVIPNEIEGQMWEDEFIYGMLSILGNYDIPVGDLLRTNSYGVVKRNGEDVVVLIDYGINHENYESYYT